MHTLRTIVTTILVLMIGAPAHAAILCATPRKDGSLKAVVRSGSSCPKNQLDPSELGLKGLTAFGSFSNDSGSAYGVTIGGVSIDLFDTAVANNVSLNTPTVTLPNAGTYRLSYCIRTTGNTSASSRLVVNGSAINASIITPVTQTDKFCRSTMLTLVSTNSTVLLQLFGTIVPVTLIAPGGAELLVEQLD
jgi:hypothetical protein